MNLFVDDTANDDDNDDDGIKYLGLLRLCENEHALFGMNSEFEERKFDIPKFFEELFGDKTHSSVEFLDLTLPARDDSFDNSSSNSPHIFLFSSKRFITSSRYPGFMYGCRPCKNDFLNRLLVRGLFTQVRLIRVIIAILDTVQ